MSSAPPPLPPALPRSSTVWVVAGIDILLFLISLALPAFYLANGDVWYGAQMLLMGWMGLFIAQFGWLANVFWVVSLGFFLFRKETAATFIAVVALVTGCLSLSLLVQQIPLDEGGVRKTTGSAFGPAFYIWLVALILPAAAGQWQKIKRA